LNDKVLCKDQVPREKLGEENRIGTAAIGILSVAKEPDARFEICNRNGRMDEFYLFATALTDYKIRKIYKRK
jgi:hypothetical protein